MKKRSDMTEWDAQRQKIIGLGETSMRKTYFPQLQQKLGELERFRALLDQTRDSIFLIIASSLAIVDVNSSACREMQCSRETLLSSRMHDFLPDDAIRELGSAASSRKNEGERIIVTSLTTCSGDELPVEITFRLVTFNGVLYGVAVARDIRDRRRAEEELKQSEERLRFASAAAGIGTWNWDLKTNELIWSARCKELFGFPPDFAVTYDSFLGAIWEEDREMVDEAVQRALREHLDYLAEMRVVLPDRSLRWVLCKGSVFHDERGNPVGMHGICLDITPRKNYENELQRARVAAEAASRAKSQFLANMSHELRTPLHGVLGVLQLFVAEYVGRLDERQKELLLRADRSARALLGIIEDILDLSSIEAGKLSLKEESFFLRETITYAIELFAIEARDKGLDLRLTVDEDVPVRLTGDMVRLRQVLVNLVGNAVKFTLQGAVNVAVAVDSRAAGGRIHVRFTVTDTGIGIPEDKRDILFRSFTQVDPSDTRRFGGSGLGLAISSRLVEMMNGTIRFESEVGVGSTFTVTVPLREVVAGPENLPSETAAAPSRDAGAPHKILVAEDDILAAELIREILAYHDVKTDLAGTGLEAVQMWEKGDYDLIIMDVQMPKMDGITATRLIREKERSSGAHIPIMAMTAHAFPEDEKRCRAAGMDAYQTKPLDVEHGMETIFALLGRKRSKGSGSGG